MTTPQIRFSGFDDEWEMSTLGHEVHLINGRAYSQPELLVSGKYPVLRVGNFYTNTSWYYSDLELGDKYYADNGDLLYTWSASFGPHVWNGGKVIYHYHIWKIELGQRLDRDFLLQLLENDKAAILAGQNGSTMVHVTKEGMEARAICFPSAIEQEAIGDYFRNLDGLISAGNDQLVKLRNLKQSMLVKMFPQAGSAVPEIRFARFDDAWTESSLGLISSIKTGPFGSTLHAEDYVPVGTPIITTEHFKDWYLTSYRRDLPQVSEIDSARLATYSLQTGDLVFSRVGSVDINAVIRSEQNGWLFSGRVLRVRLNEGNSDFMHVNLQNPAIREDIITRAVGQTMPSINTKILADTPVSIPSPTEQEAIGDYFRNIDTLIRLEEDKLTKLKNLKNSFLTQMFV